MWFNNTRNQEIEIRSDRSIFKILNGYENIDRNIVFSVKENKELEDMELQ